MLDNSSIACYYCLKTFDKWTEPSPTDRNQHRSVHEIAYGFYNDLKGVAMPFTKMSLEFYGDNTTNSVNTATDNAEWATFGIRRTTEP